MAVQDKLAPGTEIPHPDGRIGAPTREEVPIVIEADDPIGMTLEHAQTFARPPIPHADRAVHGAGEEEHLVELEGTDGARVTAENADFFGGLEVPYADGPIVRASDEDGVGRVGERGMVLEAHDAVRVALSPCISDLRVKVGGSPTLRVLVVHRPFRQFRSTTSRSQYTVFHGLVIRTSRDQLSGCSVGGRRRRSLHPRARRRDRRITHERRRETRNIPPQRLHPCHQLTRPMTMSVRMVLMPAHPDRRGGTPILQLDLQPLPLEQRQTPAAGLALSINVLSTHPPPEEVIVSQGFPALGDLGGAAEGDGVEVPEDAHVDLAGEERERVDTDDLVERVGELGELGAADGGEEGRTRRLSKERIE